MSASRSRRAPARAAPSPGSVPLPTCTPTLHCHATQMLNTGHRRASHHESSSGVKYDAYPQEGLPPPPSPLPFGPLPPPSLVAPSPSLVRSGVDPNHIPWTSRQGPQMQDIQTAVSYKSVEKQAMAASFVGARTACQTQEYIELMDNERQVHPICIEVASELMSRYLHQVHSSVSSQNKHAEVHCNSIFLRSKGTQVSMSVSTA